MQLDLLSSSLVEIWESWSFRDGDFWLLCWTGIPVHVVDGAIHAILPTRKLQWTHDRYSPFRYLTRVEVYSMTTGYAGG